MSCMKKLFLISLMLFFAGAICFDGGAVKPSIESYYSSKVEHLKTPEDIKSKCFQRFSLTVFVVQEGLDYSALGGIFDARSYKFSSESQSECYIKKNYNNASEILVMNENAARNFFGSFGETPFIKKFEIYFVSNDSRACVNSMEDMKSFIEENIRPKYQFAKIGMIKYDIQKLKKDPPILIPRRKYHPKHVCRKPSPLRQMVSYEKLSYVK